MFGSGAELLNAVADCIVSVATELFKLVCEDRSVFDDGSSDWANDSEAHVIGVGAGIATLVISPPISSVHIRDGTLDIAALVPGDVVPASHVDLDKDADVGCCV